MSGRRRAKPLLIHGFERLEYRGYDSAGLALLEDEGLDYIRAVGNLANLKKVAKHNGSQSSTGLGHTRWATHGRVSEENAHPLTGCDDRKAAVVLNGIVENFRELKSSLEADGHKFTTETDAEVVMHLVERHYEGDLVEAVRAVYGELEGHFAFVVIHRDHPEQLVGARVQCPLVVGVGDGEMFLASAVTAFLRETRQMQLIEDGEIVSITPQGATFTSVDDGAVERDVIEVDWDDEAAEKSGYETFMLKEIYEQPEGVRETIGDRVRHGKLVLEGIGLSDKEIRNLRRIVILACGTSYHAGVVGRYVIEEWARIPVEPDIASEWRYRNPVLSKDTLVVGISQSGETADVLAAMKLAREKGARTVAITNMMGSQLTREVDSVLYTRTGLEVGVAASKTFTAQVAADQPSRAQARRGQKTIPPEEIEFILDELYDLPENMQAFLDGEPSDRGDRPALLRQAVLPLPRPPYRAARRARGRAQAEGDLVHPDRGLLGRRDEARADRAPRRGHAGGLHRDRLARLRQGRLEHPGEPSARRARDRDRDRRERGHPAPRGRRHLRAEDACVPAGGPRGPSAAAPRLSDRPAAWHERRPAAELGEDRHRRVSSPIRGKKFEPSSVMVRTCLRLTLDACSSSRRPSRPP